MDGMTHSTPIPQTLADAIEAVVQERVVAALVRDMPRMPCDSGCGI